MRSYRLGYGAVFLVSLLFLYLTGSRFLAAFCVFLVFLPVLLYILLGLEAKGISITWKCRPACQSGQRMTMQITAAHSVLILASGLLQATLKESNILLGQVTRQQLMMPLNRKQIYFEFTVPTDLCGEIHMVCEKLYLFDILGLCRVSLKVPAETMLTVYPGEAQMQLVPGKLPAGVLEGEQSSQIHKGNDQSEVYDLREYHPGDDIRSIHWKLSAKVGQMMIREASDTSRFDTLVLFDVGMGQGEKEWDKHLLSDSVKLGMTISSKLMMLGIPHCAARPSAGKIQLFQVGNRSQYEKTMETWMGMELPKTCGLGLQYWKIHAGQMNFTKILYVTAGNCPEEAYQLPPGTDMTAICLQEQGEQSSTAERGMCHILNLPVELLLKNSISIYF